MESSGLKRIYEYQYDGLSRLTAVDYSSSQIGNYNERFSYDKHGNIQRAIKYGLTESGKFGLVDDLYYIYRGNQIYNIHDAAKRVLLSASDDFKDYSVNPAQHIMEYSYNQNGAMTSDDNKGITRITYNSLNFPREIIIRPTYSTPEVPVEGRIDYTYTANGIKLRTKHTENKDTRSMPIMTSGTFYTAAPTVTITDYVGNKVYEKINNNSAKIKRILIEGGYIQDGKYFYYMTDHLGNNSVVADANGQSIQRSNYYAFGMSFAEKEGTEEQPYKYNGKELDTRMQLNTYDYSARYMDPSIGRFTSMDPLMEKYYSWSPYAYVMNNPLKYIDPDGRQVGTPFGNMNFNQMRADAYNQKGQKAGASRATQRYIGLELLSYTDLNDLYLLGTAIIKGDPKHINGESASWDDVDIATKGLFLPAVSGSAVNKAGKVIDKVLEGKKFNAGKSTENITSREAFRNAKDQNGIPRSQQPYDSYTTPDKNTHVPLRVFEYRNSKGESVTIRRDNAVTYPDGGKQGPHFNAGKNVSGDDKLKQHHNYGTK